MALPGFGQPLTRTTVGAAGLVVRDDGLLMVRQVRASGTRWEVPGGGQEPGEALERTVERELAEEAAVGAVAGRLICTYASYREHQQRIGLGAFYLAAELDPATVPSPHLEDDILEAAFVDPAKLPEDEVGPLSGAVLARWWPHRAQERPPFHVEVWRTAEGYRAR